ncbi:MAG TPA: PKD domain-containing protein [Bacteroidales bacterium]|nr:PKD domain-containing protein [Bacteroidales bacterium]
MNQKVISLVTIAPRFLLLIWFFICGGIVSAQSVYVNQDLSILKNTSFYIGGYLSVGKRANVVNNGQLFIRDSIVNKRANLFFESSNPYKDNGGVPTASGASQGAVVFFGGKEQSIKALPGDTMLFSTLRVVNNSKLIFKSPGIVVLDSVKLEKGNIDLQLQNLDLFYPGTYRRSSGFIYGEDNRNNIYDSKYRTDTAAFDRFSGLVRGLFESSSSASEVARLKSMGIVFNDFSSVYSNRGHVSSPNAGDGSIRKSFLVTPANGGARIEDGMNFTYLDTADLSGLNINESKLGLFKKESTSAITFYNIGGKLNALSNEVQFSSPAFGLWTLAESNCKNPPRVVFTASKINVCQNSPFLLEGKLVSDSVSATKIYSWYRTIGTDSDTLSFTGLSIRDSLKTSDTAIYMVKVVDNRGCYSFSEVEVIPHLLPKASIHGIKTGGYCLGESVVLSDTAKFTDSDIVKRIWSFGADTLCRENVTYKYTSAGTKYVRLYVESNFGCSDTLTRTVVVHSLPSLNIRAKQSCEGLQTTMDVDKADSESYLSAEWDFGDSTKLFFDAGTYDNVLQTIVHPYASVGSKEISLIVKTSGGCMDTVTNQVHIHQPDVVNFSVSSHCAGTKANFTNQSTAYSGAATYYWIFGDGSAFTGYTPDKKYAAAQTYDVELKQVTPVCTTSVSLPVTVNGLPDATFDVSNGCLGQELIFSASNTSPDVAYNWNINGEAFATSEVSKRFALAGSYTATFQITDGNGCTSTSVKPFSVYNSPIVNFNVQPDCFGNPTRFL